MSERWDVPRTEAGRDELIELAEEYRQASMDRELGLCLTRLAHIVKHVGTKDESNAFAACARVGAEAVAHLRKTDDRLGLCRALRVAAVPHLADCDSLLNESLALAKECGDVEEEAWTTFAMRRGFGGSDPLTERALALFEQCGSLEGQAACLRTLGFSMGRHRPELLQRSIELYEQAGNEVEAEHGRQFLEVALMPEDPDYVPISEEAFEKLARMWVTGACALPQEPVEDG